MKKRFAILTMVVIVVTYGCHNTINKEDSGVSAVKPLESTNQGEQQHSESDTIELNHGARWKVVAEMMQHIRNMESDIYRFSETKHTKLSDFTQIGSNLQKNIDLLTSNCTMEGKAHDELHKWLLPYIDKVDKLNKSKNTDEASLTFEEIKASYKLFNLYFE